MGGKWEMVVYMGWVHFLAEKNLTLMILYVNMLNV